MAPPDLAAAAEAEALDAEWMPPPSRVTAPTIPMATVDAPVRPRRHLRARLLSLVALAGAITGLGYAGASAYHVITDSFVAPIILSPDNDLVIQSKLSLGRVTAERQTVAARIGQSRAAVESAGNAMARLEELRGDASHALEWSRTLTAEQATAGEGTLARLADQRRELERMAATQEGYLVEMGKNLAAGLVRKADLAREENALSELRVAALQNERDRLSAELQTRTASLAHRAMRGPGASRHMATPEMLAQREQMVHIELDLLKLQAEREEKQVQIRIDEAELAQADELIGQMKARPIFRAIESSQNVAFVPYSQMKSVRAGAAVYACEVWGVFVCRQVGQVAQLLPGEVATQDPWGTPARGQYALLTLTDPTAAQAKTLRVRGGGDAPVARTGDAPLSQR